MACFKLDENVGHYVTRRLCDAGLDALTAGAQGLAGKGDADIWSACMAEGRTLLTLDLDFGDLRRYPTRGTPGIILLRPRAEREALILPLVDAVIDLLETEELAGLLWVVTTRRVRIRGSA